MPKPRRGSTPFSPPRRRSRDHAPVETPGRRLLTPRSGHPRGVHVRVRPMVGAEKSRRKTGHGRVGPVRSGRTRRTGEPGGKFSFVVPPQHLLAGSLGCREVRWRLTELSRASVDALGSVLWRPSRPPKPSYVGLRPTGVMSNTTVERRWLGCQCARFLGHVVDVDVPHWAVV